MAIPSGLGAQLGISTESVYGTYVAPTTFQRIQNESLRLTKNYIRNFELGGQGLVQAESLHAATTRMAGGDIAFSVLDKGMGKWLNLLHGNTVTPTAVTGSLFRQTHAIGLTSPTGKSATIQVGKPDVSGTAQPFSYLGCKVANMVFTLQRDGVVTVSVTIDAQDEVTNQTLAAATYPTGSALFNFINASIEFSDVVVTDCVSQATVTIPIPLATDRFCIGNGALKKEPVPNAVAAPTIALEMEFTSLTQYNAFTAATRRKVELNCLGSTRSGTYTSALNFTAASTVTTGESPTVAGPDILTQSLTLEVLNDGTNPPLSIDYISTDSSL